MEKTPHNIYWKCLAPNFKFTIKNKSKTKKQNKKRAESSPLNSCWPLENTNMSVNMFGISFIYKAGKILPSRKLL